MLIILHGKDTFRSRTKLRELEAAWHKKHKGDFSFEKLSGAQIDFRTLRTAVENTGMFSASKFVVVEGVASNKALKGELSQYEGLKTLAGDKDTVLVLFEDASVAKDKEYKNILKAASKTQEFKELNPAQVVKWLEGYFEKREMKIAASIIKEVVKRCGAADLWLCVNELEKAYVYKAGKQITKEDLDTLGVGGEEAQIFPTIDAIFARDADEAFYHLAVHWAQGEPAERVFAMIERQLKLTAVVKGATENGETQGKIAKTFSLHPFVVKKTGWTVKKFSWGKIKDLYRRVESLDYKAKTGQMRPELACELLAAAIVN